MSTKQMTLLSEVQAFDSNLFSVHTNQSVDVTNLCAEGSPQMDYTAQYAGYFSKLAVGMLRRNGSYIMFTDMSDDFLCSLDGHLNGICCNPNIASQVSNQITSYTAPFKYPLDSIFTCAASYPTKLICIGINIFVQTVAECEAFVDRCHTLMSSHPELANTTLIFAIGNELDNSYANFVNTDDAVNYPTALSQLNGPTLTEALTYFPLGEWSARQYAEKFQEVAAYVRANYPTDKIACVASYVQRWNTPYAAGTGPDNYAASRLTGEESTYLSWSEIFRSIVDDTNYDYVELHPYTTLSNYWDSLAAITIGTRLLSTNFTDQEERAWLFHVCIAEKFIRKVVQDKERIWPTNKPVLFGETGVITVNDTPTLHTGTVTAGTAQLIDDAGFDFTTLSRTLVATGVAGATQVKNTTTGATAYVSGVTNAATGTLDISSSIFTVTGQGYAIITENQPSSMLGSPGIQQIWRMITLASHIVSYAEEAIRLKDVSGVVCANFHAIGAGTGESNSFFASGNLNANGIALSLLNDASNGMTNFCVPGLDDFAVQFTGIAQYENVRFHPVRAIYFEDGTTQKLYLVNVSPNNRTITLPFADYSVVYHADGSTPANPFTVIPDTLADTSALSTASASTGSYILPALSVAVITNTGTYISQIEVNLTVT